MSEKQGQYAQIFLIVGAVAIPFAIAIWMGIKTRNSEGKYIDALGGQVKQKQEEVVNCGRKLKDAQNQLAVLTQMQQNIQRQLSECNTQSNKYSMENSRLRNDMQIKINSLKQRETQVQGLSENLTKREKLLSIYTSNCTGKVMQTIAPPYTQLIGPNDRLKISQSIGVGQALQSQNQQYTLGFSTDGRLRLYNNKKNITWISRVIDQSSFKNTTFIVGLTVGGLSVYAKNNTKQSILLQSVSTNSTSVLVLQNNGNLVVYTNEQIVWQTNTAGK